MVTEVSPWLEGVSEGIFQRELGESDRGDGFVEIITQLVICQSSQDCTKKGDMYCMQISLVFKWK